MPVMAQRGYKTILLFLLAAGVTNAAPIVIDKCTASITYAAQSTDQEVAWLINIPNGDEHKFFRMQFKSLETAQMPYDLISLHDGDNETSPLLVEINAKTGQDSINIPFYTTGRSTLIRSKFGRRGFQLDFDCDKVVKVVNKGVGMNSFPGTYTKYQANSDWAIHFEAPNCKFIELTFSSLSIADDNITIYDGPNELAPEIITIRNDTLLLPIDASGQSMFLRIISTNSTLPRKGFTVILACDSVDATVNGTEGWVRYPKYGGYIADDQDLKWLIKSPNGKPMRLYVTHMDDSPEDSGWLRIYDGTSKSDPEVLSAFHLSPSQIVNTPFYTTGPYAYVSYYSTVYGEDSAIGFGLKYDTEKVIDVINSFNATVTYPEQGTYKANEDVAWQLNTENCERLCITFEMLDIEADSDFAYIYDGPTEDAKLLAKVTNDSTKINLPFVTSTNKAYIRFTSGSKAPVGRGIRFHYYAQSPKVVEVDSKTPWLRYPENGGLYTDGNSVAFRHTIPKGIFMKIFFNFLDIGDKTTIRIYDGLTTAGPRIAEITNDTKYRYEPVITQGRHVFIAFESKGDGSRHAGFGMRFAAQITDERTANCSGVIKYPFGEELTPVGVDGNYWRIQAPDGLRLMLTIRYLDDRGDTWRMFAYDGKDATAPMIADLQFKDTGRVPIVLFTTDLVAFVKFTTYAGMDSKGFELAYECQNTVFIEQNEGWINHYRKPGQDVRWQINIPSNKPVRLYFTDALSSEKCDDVAYVYNGPTTDYDVLATVRGYKYIQTQIFATGPSALVRYVTENKDCGTLNRLQLTFDSDRVRNDSTGTIKYPKEGGEYTPYMDVGHVVNAPAGKTVKITFTKLDIGRDNIDLRDGPDYNSPMLIHITGEPKQFLDKPYYTKSQSAYIFLNAKGHSGPTAGFIATYESVSAAWNVLRSSNPLLLISLPLLVLLQPLLS